MRLRPELCLGAVLLVFLQGWAAKAEVLGYGEADALSQSAGVRAATRTVTAWDAVEDDAAAAAALHELADNETLSAPAREAALYATLLALSARPAGPQLQARVGALADRETRLFVRHSDSGHRARLPIFDVAAAARYAQRRWRAASIHHSAKQALRTGAPLPRPKVGDVAGRAGLAAAVDAASDAELLAGRDAIAAALRAGPAGSVAALSVGQRLDDAPLLALVVELGDNRSALAAIAHAATLTDPVAAYAIVDAGLARSATASRALFVLGLRADREPAARARLLALLGHPDHGGSAAAALARSDDPALYGDIAAQLDVEEDPLRAARLALTLRLADRDEARARLARFAATPGRHPALRAKFAEVAQ